MIGEVPASMLKNTFLHIPGIGYLTEQKLWTRGFVSWEDYLNWGRHCPVSFRASSELARHLGESVKSLAMVNAGYFEMLH